MGLVSRVVFSEMTLLTQKAGVVPYIPSLIKFLNGGSSEEKNI